MNYKLGIIVPYRDRYEHLEIFEKHIVEYLSDQDIDYELIIVEQDDEKLFNRGILLNIGFKYAEELGCDYVVFHDVDMLPIDVDYSYSDIPLHLATGFEPNQNMERIVFDTYFGGVTLFPVNDFKKVNGYSNEYWGWGYEDDDLLLRCKRNDIKLEEKEIENQFGSSKVIHFNGVNSYVRGKNKFNLNKSKSILISFFPDDIVYDLKKQVDTFSIFSIPGYDFSLSYNSFYRYNFCAFDVDGNALYVNSNIKTNYRTTMIITIDIENKKIKVYQDGEIIGILNIEKPLMDYQNEEFFYLGVGNPNRIHQENFFKGYFEKFMIFSGVLDENQFNDLPTENVTLYYKAKDIKEYKLVDLSGNKNDGEIFNCNITRLSNEDYKTIYKPFRRKSLFRLLEHEENGFVDNKWKTQFTRWNQLKFNNEVLKPHNLSFKDGLSNLRFIEHSKIKINNENTINVGI